jgi:hypothetical protein
MHAGVRHTTVLRFLEQDEDQEPCGLSHWLRRRALGFRFGFAQAQPADVASLEEHRTGPAIQAWLRSQPHTRAVSETAGQTSNSSTQSLTPGSTGHWRSQPAFRSRPRDTDLPPAQPADHHARCSGKCPRDHRGGCGCDRRGRPLWRRCARLPLARAELAVNTPELRKDPDCLPNWVVRLTVGSLLPRAGPAPSPAGDPRSTPAAST